MVPVDIRFSKTFKSAKSVNSTIEYLSNFEKALPTNLPEMSSFTKVGPSSYEWRFKKANYGGQDFSIHFTTKFEVMDDRINIYPEKKESTAEMQGSWRIAQISPSVSSVTFSANLRSELPIPSLLKGIAVPLIQKEVSKIFDRYTVNVEKALK
jgi:hypothetical protein